MRVCRADYADPVHAAALVDLLDVCARDPAGGDHPSVISPKTTSSKRLAAGPQARRPAGLQRDCVHRCAGCWSHQLY